MGLLPSSLSGIFFLDQSPFRSRRSSASLGGQGARGGARRRWGSAPCPGQVLRGRIPAARKLLPCGWGGAEKLLSDQRRPALGSLGAGPLLWAWT